jgi:prevent-host-death family protein
MLMPPDWRRMLQHGMRHALVNWLNATVERQPTVDTSFLRKVTCPRALRETENAAKLTASEPCDTIPMCTTFSLREVRNRILSHPEEISRPNDGRDSMKRATVRDLQKRAGEFVAKVQKDRIVITQDGQPAVVLVGVTKQDWESVVLQTDTKFWKLISARRKQPTRSLALVRERLRRRR